jgi:Flp pilus assembly protein TadG
MTIDHHHAGRSAGRSAPNICSGLSRRLAKILRDCRATVAIEFAFALPILCLMVFALYEVTQGVITYMKVVDVANTVGDLIGQIPGGTGNGVGNIDFNNYYTAGQMVMYPSSGSNLALAITSVYYNSSGASPTVAWSIERGGAAAITNPTGFVGGLGTANSSTIIIQATYTYTSLLNYFITSPIVITSEVVAQPRNFLPQTGYDQGIPCPPPSGLETCD